MDVGVRAAGVVAVLGSTVKSLDVSRARFTDVDLRGAELQSITGLEGLAGATLSELQVSLMAGMFAGQLAGSYAASPARRIRRTGRSSK